MTQSQPLLKATIAPSNSIIFIADPTGSFDVPEITPGGLVWHSADCVAVGTLYEGDGATTIALDPNILECSERNIFSGPIETQGRTIAIITATADVILSMPVPNTRTRLNIWANDGSEPDLILIEAR